MFPVMCANTRVLIVYLGVRRLSRRISEFCIQGKQPQRKGSRDTQRAEHWNVKRAGNRQSCASVERSVKEVELTNGHASRNVLQHRSNIIHGKGETVSSVGSDDAKSVGTFSTVGSSRKTKAELLDQQAQSLRSMAQSMQTSTSMRQALLAQKVQESAQRIEQGKLAIRQQELDYLQSLRSANVITQEEFEQQVRAKLSL